MRVKVSIEIDVELDELTGPTLRDVADQVTRFGRDLSYAQIYKQTGGDFEYVTDICKPETWVKVGRFDVVA